MCHLADEHVIYCKSELAVLTSNARQEESITDIPANRRDMLRATAGFAGASLLGVLGISPALAAEIGKVSGRSEQPLKAAFSNIGLQVGWWAQGKQAAEYWGKLYNVEVTWFDGKLSATKQRAAIDAM